MLAFSCSKKEVPDTSPKSPDEAFKIYNEAYAGMIRGDLFFASKKFTEAEQVMGLSDYASKSAIMSIYCLYSINFFDESVDALDNFIKKYPADKHIEYAEYLYAIIYYEKILDKTKDINPLILAKERIINFIQKYPDGEYSIDLKFKKDLIDTQLAAKELYIAKYYIQIQKWVPAINRLKTIVTKYDQTIFVEEALHRLVEIYYKIGLVEEANSVAAILGYNYNSSEWYKNSYKILNKNYKIDEVKKNKDSGLINRIKDKIFN